MHKIVGPVFLSLMLAVFSAVAPHATAEDSAITSSVDPSALPKNKQTSLGLYVTAKEAASFLQSRKDITLIDIRTPEETMFVGYPEGAAANIPFKLVDPAYSFNAKTGSYNLILNRDFVASLRAFLNKPAGKNAKTLFLMCRSGGRSAQAVDALAEVGGFSNVYSVVDGFEGDKDANGKRTIDGWMNSGAPWTTKVREGYWFRSR